MIDSAFDFLAAWFAAHCDGDWEHDLGIRIETLDNPGWSLSVRVEDTELEGIVIDWTTTEETESVWLHWRCTGVELRGILRPG